MGHLKLSGQTLEVNLGLHQQRTVCTHKPFCCRTNILIIRLSSHITIQRDRLLITKNLFTNRQQSVNYRDAPWTTRQFNEWVFFLNCFVHLNKGPWDLLERVQPWHWSQQEKTTKHSSQTPAKHWPHSHTHSYNIWHTHHPFLLPKTHLPIKRQLFSSLNFLEDLNEPLKTAYVWKAHTDVWCASL